MINLCYGLVGCFYNFLLIDGFVSIFVLWGLILLLLVLHDHGITNNKKNTLEGFSSVGI